jgi:hypothetical protein
VRLLALLLSSAALSAADFVGADLLSGSIARGLEKAGGMSSTDFAGTLPGRKDFIEGKAAVAVLMMRERDAAPVVTGRIGLAEFRLASSVVVVATHATNRAEQITLENLANSFAHVARSPAENWNDLDPAARSELITPAVCSPAGTMALEIFQGIVLEGGSFRSHVRLRVEPDLAADLLASRVGSIVLLPRPPTSRGKVLMVSDGRPGRATTAYGPDENNVHNGDYPLQVPLVVYVRADRVSSVSPALRWLFSDEAADLLEKQGLYPAPKAIRMRYLQRLDTR